jgi:hypothetical protein
LKAELRELLSFLPRKPAQWCGPVKKGKEEENANCRENRKQNSDRCGSFGDVVRFWNSGARIYMCLVIRLMGKLSAFSDGNGEVSRYV